MNPAILQVCALYSAVQFLAISSQGCCMNSLEYSLPFTTSFCAPPPGRGVASSMVGFITAGAIFIFESMVLPYPQQSESSLPSLQRDPGVCLPRRLVVEKLPRLSRADCARANAGSARGYTRCDVGVVPVQSVSVAQDVQLPAD